MRLIIALLVAFVISVVSAAKSTTTLTVYKTKKVKETTTITTCTTAGQALVARVTPPAMLEDSLEERDGEVVDVFKKTTITVYSTHTITKTSITGPCPTGEACSNPQGCDGYQFYTCGSDGSSDCTCGYDIDGSAYCFHGGPCDIICSSDLDCPGGQFCLTESCCGENVCAPYDSCTAPAGVAAPGHVGGMNSTINLGRNL